MKRRTLAVAVVLCVAGACAGAAWMLTRPKILVLGFTDQVEILAQKAAKRADVRVDFWSREVVDGGKKHGSDLRRYKFIAINSRRSEPFAPELEQAIRTAMDSGTRVAMLPPREDLRRGWSNVDLKGADRPLEEYFYNGGVENWARLFRFASARYAGANHKIEPPVQTPESGLYHPATDDVFTTVGAYREWLGKAGRLRENAPSVVIDFASGWRVGSTAALDALIATFEKRGVNVYPIFGSQRTGEFLTQIKPDLIVSRTHGRLFQGERGVKLLSEVVDAPVLRSLSLLFEQRTLSEYRQTKDGMRGAGLAIGTVVSELDGAIEPTLLEALERDGEGRKVEAPIQDQMDRLAGRALRWIRLRRIPNAEKRVAVVYFNGLGKASFTAAGLNVPRSLVRLLQAMKESGYAVSNPPQDDQQLLNAMLARGRNVSEAEPGELERMVESNTRDLILVDADEYARWFATLPDSLRAAVTEAYGPAPGSYMVVRRDGRNQIVLPGFQHGNVLLLPQPARGAKMDSKLQHSDRVPPPHQYLAAYWYLEQKFKADALVHYGTHGTYEFLPGRPVGQLDDDWSARVIASLPNVYIYTMDNVGEALLAKRRGSAVLVSHQTPPIAAAQLSVSDDDLASLYRATQQFTHQDGGALKESMRSRIREIALKRNLDADLKFDWMKKAPTDDEIAALDQYLDDLEEAKVPLGLHVHGKANQPSELALTVTEILGRPWVERVAGKSGLQGEEYRRAKLAAARRTEQILTGEPDRAPQPVAQAVPVERTYIAGATRGSRGATHPGAAPKQPDPLRPAKSDGSAESDRKRIHELREAFAATANEIPATLRALNGRYIPPGGGGDPVRAPKALPTGRNLYGVNPAEIPTQSAWDVGVKLANDLVAAEQKRLGRYPRKVGFNLWNTELIRQYGVDLAQILWLVGVRPVWDSRGIVTDLKLVPAPELKRPRIDVVIQAAAQFRDSFPDRMDLIDRAVRMAADAGDGENFVAEDSDEALRVLKTAGLSAEDAKTLSKARIFSNAPGGYGTGLTGAISDSGAYTDTKPLTDEYLNRAGAVYTKGAEWGRKVDGLYENALKHTDAVSLSQSSNTTSVLTLDHYYEYLGGMTMAIRDKHGNIAAAYLSDTRDANKTRITTVESQLATDLRTKMWNQKWIESMKANSHSGASEIATLASNLYGWQVAKPDAVQDYMWNEVHRIYVDDAEIRRWFDKANPHAFQNLTATMLEAARKGYWKADAKTLASLSEQYAASVGRHGSSGGERTTANAALDSFVRRNLNAPGQDAVLAGYTKALNSATSTTGNAALVVGQKLVREASLPPSQTVARNSALGVACMAALAAMFWVGFRRKPQI